MTNNMAGGGNPKSKHVVSDFAAAKKSTTALNDKVDGTAPPKTNGSEENPSTWGASAKLPSNSAGTNNMELPPSAGTASVGGAMQE